MAYTHALATNNYGTARLIVATNPANGTHVTLASAMADAVSGDTIFLRNSVTENVTITPGVNIAAWTGGTLNTPAITGTLTMTGAGTSNISGLELITNSAAIIAVTGSAASILNVRDCYLNCSNNTGITYSSSSGSSSINIFNCTGNLGTTGIAYFTSSGASSLNIYYSRLSNTGGSSTANTVSAGTFIAYFTTLSNPTTSSSTASIFIVNSKVDTAATNSTGLTVGGSGSSNIFASDLSTGSASCISISSSAGVNHCILNSSNSNTISGAGTIFYSCLAPNGNTVLTINTTTQTNSGTIAGSKNTAPSAGFLGERLSAYGSAVALSTGTPANITSVSLTAGVWDISIVSGVSFSVGGVAYLAGISPTSATLVGNMFDQQTQLNTTSAVISVSIPAWRVVLTATTTYFLVGTATFGSGTGTGAGRISATRVG